mgnify:CR=1 FL=1
MNKLYFAAASCGAFLLAACGEPATEETASEAEVASVAEDTGETATAGDCDQEAMMAKAQELSEKVQGMASDPAALQEFTGKLQEIQQKVQEGAADGSFTVQQACDAYDEMLAA